MLRLCRDVADRTYTPATQHRPRSSPACTARSIIASSTGQPFNLVLLAQRAAMAAALERVFGIPFHDSVRPATYHA